MNTENYFFLLTSGWNDRDFNVDGLYACGHQVTQADWDDFRQKENLIRRAKRAELCTADTPRNVVLRDETLSLQLRQFREWEQARGTPALLFIATHDMRKLDYVEIDSDGDF